MGRKALPADNATGPRSGGPPTNVIANAADGMSHMTAARPRDFG
jgi:hypothetical protein